VLLNRKAPTDKGMKARRGRSHLADVRKGIAKMVVGADRKRSERDVKGGHLVDIGSGERPDFVDAHHHLQDLTHNSYPWMQQEGVKRPMAGDISGILRDYMVADLRRDVSGVNLIKSVHIQHGWDPTDSVGETRWLEKEAEKTGLPTAIVAFADLSEPKVGELLAAHAAYPRVRGIRQLLKWHPDPKLSFASKPDLVDDPDWRRGYALLRQFNMSFDAQVFPPQLDGLARLAGDFPATPLILGHAGVPLDQTPQGMKLWSDGLKALAERPNTFVKLSGYGLYGGRDWSVEKVGDLMLRIIDIFGADRCMCASNLPVDAIFAEPHKITDMFRYLAGRSTPAEAAMLLRGAAETAYRI
jgi:predicted TIM-barrel fold metal-dependent hydrolase